MRRLSHAVENAFGTCRVSLKLACTLPRVSCPLRLGLLWELLPYTELMKDHVQDIFDVHQARDLAYRLGGIT